MIQTHNIYLDYAAATPLTDSIKKYLISLFDYYGNPSSIHSVSEKPKQIISEARQSVAKFVNANPKEIYFTSGGAASNTLAVRGFYARNDCTVLYSPIAHKSMMKCAQSCFGNVQLRVDETGVLDICDLEERLKICVNQPFVVIDYANPEIGTIQDIEAIIKMVHSYDGIVYLDCTGSIPQIPIDVKTTNIDMIGFSGHKLGSLKGCGVLYKKPDIELDPLIYGTQEQSLVGGTENVLGIASLGKAVEEHAYSSISPSNRDYVYNYIINNIPDSYLIGAATDSGNRLPHNLYVCFKGVEGESLMILLDMNGIQVSTGSACSSGDLTPSTTLSAIGMNREDIYSCIRLSFSGQETKEALNYTCRKLKECVRKLRSFA
ncbi:MAG: cysteine desulfurase [Clostridium sp.]|nr:cysteine desulfurase [Clostridium sp.]MCM1460723.1 cysteine desulfurase [Bacteroides sp.]